MLSVLFIHLFKYSTFLAPKYSNIKITLQFWVELEGRKLFTRCFKDRSNWTTVYRGFEIADLLGKQLEIDVLLRRLVFVGLVSSDVLVGDDILGPDRERVGSESTEQLQQADVRQIFIGNLKL